MRVFDNIEKLSAINNEWVLSIGNFDGFHRGHQQILAAAKKKASQLGCKCAVVTFRPHPASILRPERAPDLINTFELKCRYILDFGVDAIVAIDDSYRLLNMSPERFVDDFLMSSVKPVAVVEGSNFHFGYGRSGNMATLKRLGEQRGFEVVSIEMEKMAFPDGLQRVSSSLIRGFLMDGRVEDAGKALGRDFRLIGKVIEGRGIGRKLGFPTANIKTYGQIVPAEGVYAGRVVIAESSAESAESGQTLPAVFSLGRAKTFVGKNPLLIEAHILEPNEQVKAGIYGKWLGLDFVFMLRHQQRFDSFENLKSQIARDCRKARELLADGKN